MKVDWISVIGLNRFFPTQLASAVHAQNGTPLQTTTHHMHLIL